MNAYTNSTAHINSTTAQILDMEIKYIGGVTTLVVLVASLFVWYWRNHKGNGMLPPGSLGLPIIGETIQLITPGYSLELSPFLSSRIKRYGTIFKTNIMGGPIIVSADEELNEMIFQKDGKLFDNWFPYSFDQILCVNRLREKELDFKYIKSMLREHIGPKRLKEELIRDFAKAGHAKLAAWAQLPSFELTEAISTLIFDLVATKLLGYSESSSILQELKKNVFDLTGGFNAVPVYLLGTSFYKSMKGRRAALKILKETLKERMSTPEVQRGDIWDSLVKELSKKDPIITESTALDLMLVLLFVSYVVNTPVVTCAFRFLTDNSEVVERLEEEQEEIMKKTRERQDSEITWEDYKSMTYTSQVITEIHRLGNINPGIFRTAKTDIEFKGYTIPKGWKVLVCTPTVHLNPKIHEDPLSFNPSRWKDKSVNARGSNEFLAFGFGQRFCVGADFSVIFMTIFLHCLITNYRWKIVKGGTLARAVGPTFPDGFQVQLIPKNSQLDLN